MLLFYHYLFIEKKNCYPPILNNRVTHCNTIAIVKFSSKDFLLQWRSSNARCLSWSRCFFILVQLQTLKNKNTWSDRHLWVNSLLEFVPKRYGSLTSYCSLSAISNIEVGRVLSLHERRGNGILPPAMRREKSVKTRSGQFLSLLGLN